MDIEDLTNLANELGRYKETYLAEYEVNALEIVLTSIEETIKIKWETLTEK